MAVVIGLDIGTTTTKACAYEVGEWNRVLASASRPSRTLQVGPNGSECRPAEVLRLVEECLGSVTDAVDRSAVQAIGITGTACGAWLSDDSGLPVRNAILWTDGRAREVLETWASEGILDLIFDVSGNAPFPGYTLAVLAWMKANEADTLSRASSVLMCKDWVRLQMSGDTATDETDASFVPFDIRNRRWSSELLTATGLADLADLFPPIEPSDRCFELSTDFADRCGLRPGLSVGIGATDIAAGVVGAGGVATGQAITILGTSSNSSLITDVPDFTPRLAGIMAVHPLAGFIRTMVNTSGSTTLDWGASLLAGGSVEALLELAGECGIDDDRPIMIPYLSDAGVVSPVVAPGATGSLHGLRLRHLGPAIARAIVEGLAFATADCLNGMARKPVDVTAVGGASRSDLLLQSIADATGTPVRRIHGDQAGARGAGILASWGSGLLTYAEAVEQASAVVVDRTFEPSNERIAERFERYLQLRAAAIRPMGAS